MGQLMSIRKKDRSFENMLKDIHVEEVPVEYIDWIKVYLDDGTEIVFKREDLSDIKTSKEVLGIKPLEQYLDRIVDFEVMMNSELIKSRVTRFVGALLAGHFNQE
jgi:hypothetical protein